MAFRLLPLPMKVNAGAKAFAELFNNLTDQRVRIEEGEGVIFWIIERCPLCWEREFTERIRIDGKPISQRRLVQYVEMLKPAIENHHATFFEATTAIAFLYFADERVDIAMIETGLGGRLDSTNVVTPLLSIITNIGLDHMEYLGPTLREIASEKGGIIKPGVPVVVGNISADVEGVLRGIARRRRSPYNTAADIVAMPTSGGGKVSFSAKRFHTPPALLGLDGSYQRVNARMAAAVVTVLKKRPALRRIYPRLTASTVQRGTRGGYGSPTTW